jgi:hypothetical protein
MDEGISGHQAINSQPRQTDVDAADLAARTPFMATISIDPDQWGAGLRCTAVHHAVYSAGCPDRCPDDRLPRGESIGEIGVWHRLLWDDLDRWCSVWSDHAVIIADTIGATPVARRAMRIIPLLAILAVAMVASAAAFAVHHRSQADIFIAQSVSSVQALHVPLQSHAPRSMGYFV